MNTPESFDDLDLGDLDELGDGLDAPGSPPQPSLPRNLQGDPGPSAPRDPGRRSPARDPREQERGEQERASGSRAPSQSQSGDRRSGDIRSGDTRSGDSRQASASLAPARAPSRSAGPIPRGTTSQGYTNDYSAYDPNRYRREEESRYTGAYTRAYAGGGNYGGGSGATGSGSKRSNLPSNLTILALVALISFFVGFASRNTYDNIGGFDDERLVTAQEIPQQFRSFCITYNGYPSFTLVQLTSISTLTVSTVPILRLDTCTIPVNQTANALQALGIQRRADTIGPQLGGSNLTLIAMPVTTALAQAIFNQVPQLRQGQQSEADVIRSIEQAIDTALASNLSGLEFQSLTATNIPGVYGMVPGHSFNLRPGLRPSQQ